MKFETDEPIENFTFLDTNNKMAIANGNLVTFWDQRNPGSANQTLSAHQKSVMKVHYEHNRKRLITGGADCMLKFHDLEAQKVKYNIKLPSMLVAFDYSANAQHYAMGLADGTILVRSKKFTKEYAEDGTEVVDAETRMAMTIGQGRQEKTSKDYRYFFRGQYKNELTAGERIVT